MYARKGPRDLQFSTRRSAWYENAPKLILIKEDGSDAVVFDSDKHKAIVLGTEYVEQGKWSFMRYHIRIPEGVIAINTETNYRDGRYCPRISNWQEFFSVVAYSAFDGIYHALEQAEQRRDAARELARKIDTPIVRQVIRQVMPIDAAMWDAMEGATPTADDIFGKEG